MDIFDSILREYKALFPNAETRENEPMSAHTSFRIGGPARLMLLPRSPEELKSAVSLAKGRGARTLVMGNGTDLLVSDDALDMAVIKTYDGVAALSLLPGGIIEAGCGALLSQTASFAQAHSLAGLEFAHGIPGTLGGGLMMNAGAYGGELRDVLVSAEVCGEDGDTRELSAEECALTYRHSRFTDSGETVLAARLRLAPGDGREIRARMEELSEKRRASQPLNMPSAGSTFKRPKNGFAAAMIDEAGLRGYAVGGAQVSEKHAGFVVNRGGATFDDVARLMDHIRETVFRRTGVTLEPEVKIIR